MKIDITRPAVWAPAAVAALGLVALGAVGARGYMNGSVADDQVATAEVAPAQPAAKPKPPVAQRCTTCGVVESVTPVRVKGEGTGLGAVAGGVLGGVVGHQMGGGSGKDAMTVIGAVGGGVAGHEIEKRQRSTTSYQVKVRMADGSLRTVTQAQAPALGQAVRVESNGSLRLLGNG
jgi:outer membrane lipoprotein SlyB